MLFSFLVTSVASTIVIDSIVSGSTLGITLYCCAKNIKQPIASKRK